MQEPQKCHGPEAPRQSTMQEENRGSVSGRTTGSTNNETERERQATQPVTQRSDRNKMGLAMVELPFLQSGVTVLAGNGPPPGFFVKSIPTLPAVDTAGLLVRAVPLPSLLAPVGTSPMLKEDDPTPACSTITVRGFAGEQPPAENQQPCWVWSKPPHIAAGRLCSASPSFRSRWFRIGARIPTMPPGLQVISATTKWGV